MGITLNLLQFSETGSFNWVVNLNSLSCYFYRYPATGYLYKYLLCHDGCYNLVIITLSESAQIPTKGHCHFMFNEFHSGYLYT